MPTRIFSLMLAAIAPLASALGPVYSLHLNANTNPVRLHPIYINDAEVHAKIPAFARTGAQVNTCYQSMTRPNLLNVTYSPTVVAPHRGHTNVLDCTVADGAETAKCEIAPSTDVFFGDNPKQYFSLGADTPLRDAIEIFNAYNAGLIRFKKGAEPWIKTLKITKIERSGSVFVLYRGDCGCSNPIKVRLNRVNGKPVVTGLGDMGGSCA